MHWFVFRVFHVYLLGFVMFVAVLFLRFWLTFGRERLIVGVSGYVLSCV